MDGMINTCRTQYFVSFAMLEKLVEQCPEDLWNLKGGGFVFWQQLLHALVGASFWMRRSGAGFSEPFAGRKVYPELDHEPEDRVTREEMLDLKDAVKAISESFFEGKEDQWLLQPSDIYDKISNLDVVFMQIRHIQYHVGHCDSILRERGLKATEWVDFFGEG